jgi:hypothetical protein
MKIDLKSFLIGALSVVCVVLLTGAKDSHEGEVGRYQLAFARDEQGGNYEIVLDTATGDVIRRNQISSVHFSEVSSSFSSSLLIVSIITASGSSF